MQRRLKQNDGFYTQNRSRVAEEAGKGDKGPAKMQKKLCFLRFLVDLAPKTTYEDGRTKLKVSETRPLVPQAGPRHRPSAATRAQNAKSLCFCKFRQAAVQNQCVFPRSWPKPWISLEVLAEIGKKQCFPMFLVD